MDDKPGAPRRLAGLPLRRGQWAALPPCELTPGQRQRAVAARIPLVLCMALNLLLLPRAVFAAIIGIVAVIASFSEGILSFVVSLVFLVPVFSAVLSGMLCVVGIALAGKKAVGPLLWALVVTVGIALLASISPMLDFLYENSPLALRIAVLACALAGALLMPRGARPQNPGSDCGPEL